MLINFLIIGAQKAGTTALSDYLGKHPNIYIPPCKEIHFFDKEDQAWGDKASVQLNYHANYPLLNTKPDILNGDATPIYSYWAPAMQRIWSYNPAIKLILCLRNPIDRAYSHWAMEVKRGWDSLTFEEAIEQEEERCKEALPHQHRIYSYISRGFYSEQIRRMWSFFPREQTLILRQEELSKNVEKTLRKVHRFLGVDYHPFASVVYANPGTYPKPMHLATRAKLQAIFDPEISQLEKMLRWDLSHWRNHDT
tara:strand:+ start:526 stop:1281 length:756 start_codon:yes stop_codon:yes gene_type:complete